MADTVYRARIVRTIRCGHRDVCVCRPLAREESVRKRPSRSRRWWISSGPDYCYGARFVNRGIDFGLPTFVLFRTETVADFTNTTYEGEK